MAEQLSPMMQQYQQIKAQYPDTILFYRLGDFYEMFFDDALLASKELDLTLTGRDCGLAERAPMCGVPFHSYEGYVSRLVEKGYKVAICEQMEDPAKTKGLVKRDIIRVITPGTVIEDCMLEEGRNNYLCTVCRRPTDAALCFVDASTGELHLTRVEGDSLSVKIIGELSRFQPSEVLLSGQAAIDEAVVRFLETRLSCRTEPRPDSSFDPVSCERLVTRHFGKPLAALGVAEGSTELSALGAALEYLYETKREGLSGINHVDIYTESQYMRLDLSTRNSLEMSETIRSRSHKGSLIRVLDKTRTAMGRRLIRSWLEQPLLNPAAILSRQNGVEELLNDPINRGELANAMSGVYDLERLMSRVLYGSVSPRELRALADTLGHLPEIRGRIALCHSGILNDIYRQIDELKDVRDLVDAAIVDQPPATLKEGEVIRAGYHPEIDTLREDLKDGHGFILRIENEERERTGIRNLRVKYNKVFGYCIEVTNSFKDQVPEDRYIRKQTLTNCERYITQELKETESRVLGARDRLDRLEREVFDEVRRAVSEQFERIQRTAAAVARLDVLCSFAQTADENRYVRPGINVDGRITIVNGRHPVVESLLNVPFVPNDTHLDMNRDRCAVITGPNMAGKSTYMRQVALITLMAQAGSFVPADSADIGIVDAIFTRVGASDDLAAGQSTFMVEMSEVANILENATANSLLIFDEIGRGTSTYDGMAIARAVLEYVCNRKKLGAKTLFATHYHELTELEGQLEGVRNYNTTVRKRGDEITFLRRVVPGAADGSYGIDVARLAGIPDDVVARARKILRSLEENEEIAVPRAARQSREEPADGVFTLSDSGAAMLIDELKMLDVNTLTPIEAMSKLHEMSQRAKEL